MVGVVTAPADEADVEFGAMLGINDPVAPEDETPVRFVRSVPVAVRALAAPEDEAPLRRVTSEACSVGVAASAMELTPVRVLLESAWEVGIETAEAEDALVTFGAIDGITAPVAPDDEAEFVAALAAA